MSDTLISVNNVSKAYRIWSSPGDRLTSILADFGAGILPKRWGDALRANAARNSRDFWALKGVSFELKKGESVGIIGRNGSGKSTLLQLVTGTLQPTTGSIQVNGRVAALLELGSGFNPEFTGRENVYLNGAVLGLTRAQIDERVASIAEFAEIGEYIDEPVKTYSSGMLVRLAFAVAFSIEPEILIVDEALSVGDIFFQQKCFKRVHELLEKGVSLLLVSHDTAAVQNLCAKALLLVKGEPRYFGEPEEAVSRYYAFSEPKKGEAGGATVAHSATDERMPLMEMAHKFDIAGAARSVHGAQEFRIEHITILNSDQLPAREFKVGEKMHVIMSLHAAKDISDPSAGLHIYDRMNNLIFAAGTRQLQVAFGSFKAQERRVVEFCVEMSIHPGEYTFSAGCSQASEEGPNHGYVQHRLEGLGPVQVVPAPAENGVWPFYGQARLPMTINIHG